jgi:hypothetical protein
MTADRHDLKRFLDAQGGTYAQATGELRRDRHRPGRPDDRGNLPKYFASTMDRSTLDRL